MSAMVLTAPVPVQVDSMRVVYDARRLRRSARLRSRCGVACRVGAAPVVPIDRLLRRARLRRVRRTVATLAFGLIWLSGLVAVIWSLVGR